ncbi:hypothetical protein Calab_1537 [Caldithrix abyssi DSM 13497]|uniref:Uncharacterized protein n=1 Tax=Caldithrix abyssi DSM 13497 TaxID=880073 RepID=H1XQL1_CALAY|nr:hypothetical protein [Caldithrix abyssi]APF17000.1 hypothetical protein Cabys_249 [Caldithrix abyssi DSM 13497]EHO41157.1 hypothetical protein Calab_1537 [Caldithrix abyssi DSM 13497]
MSKKQPKKTDQNKTQSEIKNENQSKMENLQQKTVVIQGVKLTLKPLKIRQLKELLKLFKGFKNAGQNEFNLSAFMDFVIENGKLEHLGYILFADQPKAQKIKWNEIDLNDAVNLGEALFLLNKPAIDGLMKLSGVLA